MGTFNCTSSIIYSDLNIGLPTIEAKVLLGKFYPEKPIFMYPVPTSQMSAGD